MDRNTSNKNRVAQHLYIPTTKRLLGNIVPCTLTSSCNNIKFYSGQFPNIHTITLHNIGFVFWDKCLCRHIYMSGSQGPVTYCLKKKCLHWYVIIRIIILYYSNHYNKITFTNNPSFPRVTAHRQNNC